MDWYKISFVLWLMLVSAMFIVYPKFSAFIIFHSHNHYYYNFFNAFSNVRSYKERALWRNIIFNVERGFFAWVVNFCFF